MNANYLLFTYGPDALRLITACFFAACAFYLIRDIVRAVRRILWRKRTQRQKALQWELAQYEARN